MNTILMTVAVALCLGFALGVLLGVFKKIFAVQVDPKVAQIQEALSGGNCGGCGYAGCAAFAEAVARGEASVTGCVAGGTATAEKIAQILGVAAGASVRKVAFLACNGSKDCAKSRGTYNGIQTCKAAVLAVNGTKVCAFGCTGLGDCAAACTFNALHMGSDGLPHVDYEKCTGCGKCVKTCPKHLFSLMDATTKGSVALCSNHSDNKPQIKKDCAVGCFKCGLCARKCPEKCLDASSGIPVIDYSKCTSCGECIKACPDKVLHLFQDIVARNGHSENSGSTASASAV